MILQSGNMMFGMGATDDSDILTTLTSTAKDAITAYNTQQILNANIERAKQGLPPLDASAYAPTYNVGLSPDLKNLLIIGGLGILLFMVMSRNGGGKGGRK
jgi:hypothetical protein